jgi:hypothetical protein
MADGQTKRHLPLIHFGSSVDESAKSDNALCIMIFQGKLSINFDFLFLQARKNWKRNFEWCLCVTAQ